MSTLDRKDRFPKEERLTSKKLIEELFKGGSSFSLYPFRVWYLKDAKPATGHQVLISVPKKIFRKSHERNLIKRRIREAYRLNKSLLIGPREGVTTHRIAYIYVGKNIVSYSEIEDQLKMALARLNQLWKSNV